MVKRTITFRIDEDALNQIECISRNKVTTLNKLVEEILINFIEWHAYASSAGFFPLPKPFLYKMITKLSYDEIQKSFEEIKKCDIDDMILMLRQELNTNSYINCFESWLKSSNFRFHHNVLGDTYNYVIQHNMGEKGSGFLGLCYSTFLRNGGFKNITHMPTDNILHMQFEYIE
ncbi:MAG TPA: hypothetical protein VIH04_01090 [Nitrosarchaeum sp.]